MVHIEGHNTFSIMRKFTYAIIFTVAIGVIFGFKQQSKTNPSPASISIIKWYRSQIKILLDIANDLKNTSLSLDSKNPQSLIDLRKELLSARNQFKKVEFLAAYSDPDFVKDWVNGAPLLHLERNSPSMLSVLEPEGLQILDELIFDEDEAVFSHKEEIKHKSEELVVRLGQFIKFQGYHPPYPDFMIFEATREELVRIFTLGLTGFDTPMSGNSIPEAIIAMETTWKAIEQYRLTIDKQNEELYPPLEKTFNQAINYLKTHQDFDTFDRLDYLKSYINPLYSQLLGIHQALELPTRQVYEQVPLSVNYASNNLFDNQFLNIGYYTSYETDPDNKDIYTLGQALFFDPVLSSSNKASCASCHQPDKAFTDGLAKSLAFDNSGTVLRNAPTLLNSVYAEKYFHDMRQESLEAQIEHVIVDPKEFHSSYLDIFDRLKQSPEYIDMFETAFPQFEERPISQHTIATALSSYVASLSSFNSPFDKYVLGESETISEDVKHGFNLFMGKAACGTCHFAPVFNGTVPPRYQESESEVLGVPEKHDLENLVLDKDMGRYENGRLEELAYFYKRSFKTPTIRNIALTAPYMHNGAYEDLESVMDFYNRGGGEGMGLEVPYQTLPPDALGLNDNEIGQIISFMEALTDTAGLTTAPARLPEFPMHLPYAQREIGGGY